MFSLVYENMPSREQKLKNIAKVENFLSPLDLGNQ